MFKKIQVGSSTQLKSSAVRGLKASVVEQYPALAQIIDEMVPKKGTPVYSIKCQNPRGTLYSVRDEILFVQPKNDLIFPTLRVAMQYPGMMKSVTVDKGTIRAALKGANIMAPGLTSEGGSIEGDIPAGTPVVIHVEGKSQPIAVGKMELSADTIRAEKTGVAIISVTFLGDGLWKHEK
ncbi:translation machinery-associated protein 20 [Thecamonas trahens ATCC 50062]|uniref:Translation machinery-associated protein 20 n=1 Tax=Thecamonas trahens ATCC 50062 TaxID=461836 RepID=A0A0L0D8L0_THETB|nr:translation machinery-associated protein 20 [Thecamonas trahens ATCC 50062]KNC48421.1 translation machinery-associated protein 20 [Thecamonas trahens ATCC 50062]|eukprot:XP_013758538.1 translation machinery-associated protein 20 [Thecamonas trahens ATCC 50062]